MISFHGDWLKMEQRKKRLLCEGELSLDEAELAYQQTDAQPLSERIVSSLLSRTEGKGRRRRRLGVEGLENRRLMAVIAQFWPLEGVLEDHAVQAEEVAMARHDSQMPFQPVAVETHANDGRRVTLDLGDARGVSKLADGAESACYVGCSRSGEIEEAVCELAERVATHWLSRACERTSIFANLCTAPAAFA